MFISVYGGATFGNPEIGQNPISGLIFAPSLLLLSVFIGWFYKFINPAVSNTGFWQLAENNVTLAMLVVGNAIIWTLIFRYIYKGLKSKNKGKYFNMKNSFKLK